MWRGQGRTPLGVSLSHFVLCVGFVPSARFCKTNCQSSIIEDYSRIDIFEQAVNHVKAREGNLNLAKTCSVAACDTCYCFGSVALFADEQLCS